jgi:hypothetical protein
MEQEGNPSPGRETRWRRWRERRKHAASKRSAWAEEELDRQNQERYRAWGRGGSSIGPDVGGGGDGGGGL